MAININITKEEEDLATIDDREASGWIPPVNPAKKNVTSRIYSITALGEVLITFNASMNPVDISKYNEENMLIYIERYNPELEEHSP